MITFHYQVKIDKNVYQEKADEPKEVTILDAEFLTPIQKETGSLAAPSPQSALEKILDQYKSEAVLSIEINAATEVLGMNSKITGKYLSSRGRMRQECSAHNPLAFWGVFVGEKSDGFYVGDKKISELPPSYRIEINGSCATNEEETKSGSCYDYY